MITLDREFTCSTCSMGILISALVSGEDLDWRGIIALGNVSISNG